MAMVTATRGPHGGRRIPASRTAAARLVHQHPAHGGGAPEKVRRPLQEIGSIDQRQKTSWRAPGIEHLTRPLAPEQVAEMARILAETRGIN